MEIMVLGFTYHQVEHGDLKERRVNNEGNDLNLDDFWEVDRMIDIDGPTDKKAEEYCVLDFN
jgi:hypothetical protein